MQTTKGKQPEPWAWYKTISRANFSTTAPGSACCSWGGRVVKSKILVTAHVHPVKVGLSLSLLFRSGIVPWVYVCFFFFFWLTRLLETAPTDPEPDERLMLCRLIFE